MNDPEPESLRLAMDQAWRDHHHARDQTWRAVQIEAVLGAGLITVDLQYESALATLLAGALVVLAAGFGILITLRHRDLEIRKFLHILNCEEALHLHRDDLIPFDPEDGSMAKKPKRVQDAAVKPPREFSFRAVFDWKEQNTSLFILRMHLAILLFAVLVVLMRMVS